MENYELNEITTSAAVNAEEALPLNNSSATILPLQLFTFIILLILISFIIKKLFFSYKRCPHCYSRIHKKAIFCKHCRKDI